MAHNPQEQVHVSVTEVFEVCAPGGVFVAVEWLEPPFCSSPANEVRCRSFGPIQLGCAGERKLLTRKLHRPLNIKVCSWSACESGVEQQYDRLVLLTARAGCSRRGVPGAVFRARRERGRQLESRSDAYQIDAGLLSCETFKCPMECTVSSTLLSALSPLLPSPRSWQCSIFQNAPRVLAFA